MLNAAGTILTYTDIDGDLVKITFTGGARMEPGDFVFSTGSVNGNITTPQALTKIDLTDQTGAGFTLTAAAQKIGTAVRGNSFANIDFIDGSDTNLGTIKVDGDVVRLSAGTGAVGTVGLKSFTAHSMGVALAGYQSSILYNVASFTVKTVVQNVYLTLHGDVKSITVGGDIVERSSTALAGFRVNGDAGTIKVGGSLFGDGGTSANLDVTGDVGSLIIGGSIIGSRRDLVNTAQVLVAGHVKSLTVGGDLQAQSGDGGGSIHLGSAGTIKIGGSLYGGESSRSNLRVGDGADSVSIRGSIIGGSASLGGFKQVSISNPVKTFTVGGDVRGGEGHSTGSIFLRSIGTLKIGGSLIGSDETDGTGEIVIADDAKSIAIAGSIIGGSASSSAEHNGRIAVSGNLGTLTLGRDFVAGTKINSGANLFQSSEISVIGTIGSIAIGGGIRGNETHFVKILAGGGGENAAITAIKTLNVKGSVLFGSVVAGHSHSTGVNTDAGLGSVTIGGNLIGSYINWGNTAGADFIPGNSDDTNVSTVATFTSLKVGGYIAGIPGNSTTFWVYGSILKKATIGKVTYLQPQLDNGGSDAIGSFGVISVIR